MLRENGKAEAEARYSAASATVAAPRPGLAVGSPDDEDGTRSEQSPPPLPWAAEKLWSDSDSDRDGADGDGDRNPGSGGGAAGVEESKLSAAKETKPLAMAPAGTHEEEEEDTLEVVTGRGPSSPEAAASSAVPDLLVNGGYVDAEPAEPPALADWIALGEAEARDSHALAAVDEPRRRLPRRRAHPEAGRQYGRPEAEAARADGTESLDEDSFGSGCGVGVGGVGGDHGEEAGGDDNSDADSEARLTALVARVAVRGEESRAALIVQALVRGRAARRFAAAERGRACAREEAAAAAGDAARAGAGAAAPPSPATAAEDGSAGEAEGGLFKGGTAVEDMAWLARKKGREGLSDSFGSSDSGRDEAGLLVRERKGRDTLCMLREGKGRESTTVCMLREEERGECVVVCVVGGHGLTRLALSFEADARTSLFY